MSRVLEPGFGVHVEGPDGVELAWRVSEIANDGIVLVGDSATPLPGDRVEIAWGSAEGAYRGVTRVLRTGDTRMVVERPNQIRRAQRRKFLRVPCVLPFGLVVDGERHLGATQDLSANGVRGRVRCDRPPSEVGLELVLPFGTIEAPARLVRFRRLDLPLGTFEIALCYVPDPRSEDRIVSYVLEKEREQVRIRRS